MATIQGAAKREGESNGPSWQSELIFREWKEGLEATRANWAGAPIGLKPNLLLHGDDLVVATGWYHTRSRDITPQQQSFIRKSIARSYNAAAEEQRGFDAHRKSQLKWLISFGATVSAFILFIGLELVLYDVWRTMNPGSPIFSAQTRAPMSLPGQSRTQPAKPVSVASDDAAIEMQAPQPLPQDPTIPAAAPTIPEVIPAVQPASGEDDTPVSLEDVALKAQEAAEKGDATRARLLALEALLDTTAGKDREAASGPATAALRRTYLIRRPLVPETEASSGADVVLSRNGELAILTGDDQTARLTDLSGPAGMLIPQYRISTADQSIVSIGDASIALAGGDDAIRIWKAGGVKPTAILRGHEAAVSAMAFSPDGSKAVTASWDETVRVWDARSGRNLVELRGHEGPVVATAFNQDGSRLVTAGEDRTARVWNTSDGRPGAVLRGHLSALLTAEFAPSGNSILTTSLDGTARIWDAETGTVRATLSIERSPIVSALFSETANRIVGMTGKGILHIWNAADGTAVNTFEKEDRQVRSYALGGPNDLLLVLDTTGVVSVLDSTSGREIMTASSPDGDRIVSAALASHGTQLRAVTARQQVLTWPAQEAAEGLIAQTRRSVTRCLTPEERRELQLRPAIPAWCADIASTQP